MHGGEPNTKTGSKGINKTPNQYLIPTTWFADGCASLWMKLEPKMPRPFYGGLASWWVITKIYQATIRRCFPFRIVNITTTPSRIVLTILMRVKINSSRRRYNVTRRKILLLASRTELESICSGCCLILISPRGICLPVHKSVMDTNK